jgi:AraC-like DNA-binding protein
MNIARPVQEPSKPSSADPGRSGVAASAQAGLSAWAEKEQNCLRRLATTGQGKDACLSVKVQDVLPLLRCGGRSGPNDDPNLARLLAQDPSRDDSVISLAEWFRLLHRLIELAGEETIALSSRPMMIGTAEFVLSHARQSNSLGEALKLIAQAYNVMHGGVYNIVERREDTISYIIQDEAFPYTRPRDDILDFALESMLILLHATLSELVQRDLSPFLRRVQIRRRAPRGAGASALAFWQVPIAFGGAGYRLIYDDAIAELPVNTAITANISSLAIRSRVLSMIEGCGQGFGVSKISGRFVAAVNDVLENGVFDQNKASRRLGVSNATLRRRLQDEGSGFRRLRARALCNRAKLLLLRGVAIAAVADELGFSDPRAFSRAFKLWTGETPNHWRNPKASPRW